MQLRWHGALLPRYASTALRNLSCWIPHSTSSRCVNSTLILRPIVSWNVESVCCASTNPPEFSISKSCRSKRTQVNQDPRGLKKSVAWRRALNYEHSTSAGRKESPIHAHIARLKPTVFAHQTSVESLMQVPGN